MNKKFRICLSLFLALILTLSCFVTVYAEDSAVVDALLAKKYKNDIARLVVQMSQTYYYGVEDVDLLYRALCSTINTGVFDFNEAVKEMMKLMNDGYSEYYSPERFDNLYTNIQGEYYGIGVTITLSDQHVVVAGVFPNSPAEEAGIKLYDIIVSVDGTNIAGMSASDVATLIKREKGKKVTIGVVRDGEPLLLDCYCDEVDQNPISYKILEDGKIGYIYLSTFSLNVDEFLVPVLNEFKEKGITDIILDIRNNGGGELNAATALAKHFIPEGTIAKLKYKNEANNSDLMIENGMTKSPYNMVLLVNENSASASELFAGAFKDRLAGTIIGTNTYGKGSMQNVFRLSTGAGVKYTIAEFHSPNDNRIHTVGIEPNYIIENSTYKVTEDQFYPMILEKDGDKSEGEHIIAMEQRLEALGCFDGEPDMIFDEDTANAIRLLQMTRGLEINGEPDIYTLVTLNDIIYDFTYENDDQLDAAIEFLKTGEIADYVAPEEETTELSTEIQ